MKRQFGILVCLLLTATLLISGCSNQTETVTEDPTAAQEQAVTEDLETLLAPYQEVMDKVNEELGSQFAIREGYESIVYDAYQDYTLEEFEAYLRESYAEINAASSADAAQSALDRQFTRSER